MSSAFAAAVDTLFSDPHMADDAVYTPAGGDPVAVRVIARQPDKTIDVLGVTLASATTLFDLRVSDIAQPAAGDALETGGETYIVQGEPKRDAARLVWTIEAVP